MIYRFKKTFIGVGGREYISNPKLSFPEHVKIRRRGTNPRSGQPYTEAGSAFVETSVPPCYMDMAGAVSMLGVVRSYVYRLVKKGLLREYRSRMKTARGLRVRCFYHREDLEHVRLHVLQKR